MAGPGGGGVTFADLTVADFLDRVASDRVAPSAGAVTAYNGAMAAALAEMVCHHTAQTNRTDRLEAARESLATSRTRLLRLADEDGAIVDGIHRAFEADADVEAVAGRGALERAIEVPLEIAVVCGDVVERAAVVAADGTVNARVDAVVAARAGYAAVQAAAEIVRANCGLVDDESFIAETRDRLDDVETAAADALERTEAQATRTTGGN
jgi:formiminotetrahydrofolate cyclodeaminase